MTSADWLSTICIIGLFVVIAVVAVDRNRLRHRLDNSEGRVTGLSLDLDALQERVVQLTGYLNRPQSWEVGTTPPAALADGRVVDRWTPAASLPDETAATLEAGTPMDAPSDVNADVSLDVDAEVSAETSHRADRAP